MSFDKQIQDKFSGFEPEVPEEHINAGWENIRYFLPPEKKKKRAFFFFRHSKGIGIAAMVACFSFMAFFLTREPENTGTANSEKNPASETDPAHDSAPGMKQAATIFPTPRKDKTLSQTQQNVYRYAASGASKQRSDKNQIKNSRHENSQNGAAALPFYPQAAEIPTFVILLKQASLDQEAQLLPDPVMNLSVTERFDPIPKVKQRPALEFFTGLNNRSLALQTGSEKKTVKANGFSAGIAGILPVKSKFYVGAQFIFCYNPVKQGEETNGKQIIRREVINPVSSASGTNKDTLIYYVPYKSVFELQSTTVYHLSGGVGYRLLNKGRISLDGALFLDLSWMRIHYRVSRVNSDTGIFVNRIGNSNAAAFYESVKIPDIDASVSQNKQAISLGVSPSLSLIYQLGKKTGIIFKPAYLLQLTPDKIKANNKSYRLSDNNWFIHLGVRYRF